MTEDERQAELIIQEWISKVTGTSELERGMWKAGQALRQLGEDVGVALVSMWDSIGEGSK